MPDGFSGWSSSKLEFPDDPADYLARVEVEITDQMARLLDAVEQLDLPLDGPWWYSVHIVAKRQPSPITTTAPQPE